MLQLSLLPVAYHLFVNAMIMVIVLMGLALVILDLVGQCVTAVYQEEQEDYEVCRFDFKLVQFS